MTCESCGAELVIGAWPFCPHGEGTSGRGSDVTWPGGKTFENLGAEPQTFYSKSEYQRYLKTHRLEEFVRHVPLPGSDKSPHTTSWAAVTQETLDGAKALLERVGRVKPSDDRTWVESLSWTIAEESGTVRGVA